MSEGAGIVVIETLKLFIFFLFTVIFLDAFGNKKNRVIFSFWIIVIFSILMVAIVAFLKDTGSLIQVIVALSIIVLFFFTHLKKIGFINNKLEVVIEPRFDFAYPFENGKARVCNGCTKKQNGEHYMIVGGKWGVIDQSGKLISPIK
jgi:hypothetical protein